MHWVRADIDELLQATEEMENSICNWIVMDIEIDDLLEDTKNWI
jgi:hypothetical protein